MKSSKSHTGNITSLFPHMAAWILVDEGHENQVNSAVAISDAMGLIVKIITVRPNWPYNKLPYLFWRNPRKICSSIRDEWPPIAIAVGPHSSAILKKMRQIKGVFSICFAEYPHKSKRNFDFFIEFSKLKSLPHGISSNILIEAKRRFGRSYEDAKKPLFLLKVDKEFTQWEVLNKSMECLGGSVLMHGNFSKETLPEQYEDKVTTITSSDDSAGNYLAKLAMADAFICDAHDIEFISEATSARKPIFIYNRNTVSSWVSDMLSEMERQGFIYEFNSSMVVKILGVSYLELPIIDEANRLSSLIWKKFHDIHASEKR